MAEKLFNQVPPDPPKISPLWNKNDSLGVKIEKMFLRVFQSLWGWGWGAFAEVAVHIFDASMKILKPGMLRMFAPFLDEIAKTPGMPEYIKSMIQRVKDEKGEAGAVGVGALVIALLWQVASAVVQPIANLAQQSVNRVVPNTPLDPTLAAAAQLRGLLDLETYSVIMDLHGWGDRDKNINLAMTEHVPSIGEIIEFYRRGLINEPEFDFMLKKRQINSADIRFYKDLATQTPPITDLIRFMVREAFNDGTSAKFGYDDDYPSQIDPFLPRVGLSSEWGRRYWRAHWTLPSPTQGYEMLHRGLINEGDLFELLKTQDYPSFWRDKLMKISYNPLTRVDLRRMYQAGLIDREKVHRTYKEMGYNDEDAELLTKFAEQGTSEREKDLTRSDIIGLYVDGLTDRGAAAQGLIKMGYDSEEAEAMLKRADFDISRAARVDLVNYVAEKYKAGQIDEIGARSELVTGGLKDKAVDRYLMTWKRQAETEVRELTQADARRLYKKGIITLDQFRKELRSMKYSNRVIDLFVKEIEADKAQEA